jgi:hypothetical protein
MPKLSHSVSGAFRTFSFWIANGTVGHPLLDKIDYKCIFDEPSALQAAYAIFANVLEFDETEQVLNAKYAEKRAAQSIRRYLDPEFRVEPPFEDWEVALRQPPPRIDPKQGT